MPPQLPEKPKFVSKVTAWQKILASVSGSMFVMALITLLPIIQSLFTPNYLLFLSTLRMIMAVLSLVTGGFVGIEPLLNLATKMFELYSFYKEFKDKMPKE